MTRLSKGSRLVVDGFIERFGPAKSDVAIKLDGGGVFRGHLEIGLVQSRLTEAGRARGGQGLAQPQTPVLPEHSHILDRPDWSLIHHSLDRAHITVGAGDQPGRAGRGTRAFGGSRTSGAGSRDDRPDTGRHRHRPRR